MSRVLARGIRAKEVLTRGIHLPIILWSYRGRAGGVLARGVLARGVLAIHHILELPWGVRAEELRAKGVLAGGFGADVGSTAGNTRTGSARQGSTRQRNTHPSYFGACGEYVQGKYAQGEYTHRKYSLKGPYYFMAYPVDVRAREVLARSPPSFYG